MSDTLILFLTIMGIFALVGAIAYFAAPGRDKPALHQMHHITLPEWSWTTLALGFWIPIWGWWLIFIWFGLQSISNGTFTPTHNILAWIFMVGVLPTLWLLIRGRWHTLVWLAITILTAGRQRRIKL